MGPKNGLEVKLYIFSHDIVSAMSKYKYLPAMKKSLAPKSVRELSEHEAADLEESIKRCRIINGVFLNDGEALAYAKTRYFSPSTSVLFLSDRSTDTSQAQQDLNLKI